jgi:phospholipid/cholesterol/gamma-HCH transport system permease protein
MGRMLIFLSSFFYLAFQPPLRIRHIIKEMHSIGVHSLLVILLTASFTGLVLGLQGYYTLRQFGSEALLGSAVALSLIRELGPVLGALMVTARAGSAMTAELGIMKISEQIDALDVMTINPIKFLVRPKILAGILVLPLLVSIFDVVGIYSGYVVGVKLLGVTTSSFFHEMASSIVFKDIYTGIIKSVAFGLILTWVCCYKGYYCGRGAKGVGKATTEAVVLSAVLILMLDYFLTSVLL